MRSKITIAAVIPCYNSETTVAACIRSIYRQSEPIDEIIIVDDGSVDNTVDMIRQVFAECPTTIQYRLVIQKNSGPSRARNQGVEQATSSHIAFLDADDEWRVDHLKNHKTFLISNSQYDLVATKYKSGSFKFFGEVKFHQLLFKNYFLTPCVVVKKTTFLRHKGFNEDMRFAEDYFLYLSILSTGRSYILNYLGGGNIEGKKIFGQKGLSSNLSAMHQGVLNCYYSLMKQKKINFSLYGVLVLMEHVKYMRRRVLSKYHEARYVEET